MYCGADAGARRQRHGSFACSSFSCEVTTSTLRIEVVSRRLHARRTFELHRNQRATARRTSCGCACGLCPSKRNGCNQRAIPASPRRSVAARARTGDCHSLASGHCRRPRPSTVRLLPRFCGDRGYSSYVSISPRTASSHSCHDDTTTLGLASWPLAALCDRRSCAAYPVTRSCRRPFPLSYAHARPSIRCCSPYPRHPTLSLPSRLLLL